MKRVCSLVGICLLASTVPALAGEGTHYAGPIHDNHKGFIEFDLVKNDDGRFVRNLDFTTFVKCENGKSGTLSVQAKGRFRVKHGKWGGTHETGPTEIGEGGEATFAGRLLGGGEAKGTIRFRDAHTQLGECKSRIRDWEASVGL